MGGAVLGVWYYQRMFPPQLPFTVSDGVTVGALSGVLAGIVSPVIEMLDAGLFSEDFAYTMEERITEAFENPQMSGADPVAMQEAMDVIMQLLQNPAVLFAIILAASLLIYAGFGALGGVIGGNIFKTKVVPEDRLPVQ